MSTQNRSTLVGLAASGLFWMATSVALGQGGIALQAPPSSPAPASSTYSVLLLTGGKVVRGSITRDASGANYVLKRDGVPISYRASMVQMAGGSIEELYQFLLSRLAVRDPDERMKLARWCIAEGLPGHAKEQLAATLAMSPGDPDATRMQYNLAAADERAGKVDEAVRRTGGEAPAPLDSRVLKDLRRDYGRDALPEIFDLPQAQAVARAGEFTQKIHPILQNRCASCHNERYQGTFQLVVARARRDMSPDVARANLDATLKLVNPDDLARSEILSAGLVPHGPNKDAIFRGPNDLEYRMLATWVRSLRAASPAANAAARPGLAPSGDGFAADRPNRSAPGSMPLTPVAPTPDGGGFPPLPGTSARPPAAPADPSPGYLPGESHRLNADFSGGLPDSAFPVPYAAGGRAPEGIKPAPAVRAPAVEPAPGSPVARPATPTTATVVDANTVLIGPTTNPNQLPGMNQERYPPKKATGASAKKPKASELDPALLEQLVKKRNGSP